MIQARRAAREAALVILFAVDAGKIDSPEAALTALAGHLREDEEVLLALFGKAEPTDGELERLQGLFRPDSGYWSFVERLVQGAMGHANAIDELVGRCSLNWKIARMNRVDRNILRLAAYELAFEPDVPVRATLNEAIEMAKRYGTEDSSKFVNGILDRIAQELGRV